MWSCKKIDSKKWFDKLNSTDVNKNHEIYKKYVIAKLQLIDKMFGIGLPTTCGYSRVYGSKTRVQYIYGTYVQMFFSIKIETNMMHHAFSWCFPHATAVPLGMTKDDHILICNEDSNKECSEGDVYLCAWGSSGGAKHASVQKI